jgi:hypothetical protein
MISSPSSTPRKTRSCCSSTRADATSRRSGVDVSPAANACDADEAFHVLSTRAAAHSHRSVAALKTLWPQTIHDQSNVRASAATGSSLRRRDQRHS